MLRQIPPMTLDEGYSKFEGILKAHHRSVNKEQRDLVSKYIQECPLPLYVEVRRLGRVLLCVG